MSRPRLDGFFSFFKWIPPYCTCVFRNALLVLANCCAKKMPFPAVSLWILRFRFSHQFFPSGLIERPQSGDILLCLFLRHIVHHDILKKPQNMPLCWEYVNFGHCAPWPPQRIQKLIGCLDFHLYHLVHKMLIGRTLRTAKNELKGIISA